MNPVVERYVPLVDFLETALSRNSEIVLHDFTDLSHSVVDIRNGHVSGRAVGAPATDFVLRVISGEEFSGRPSTPAYLSHSVQGKPLRSTSYFIRDGARLVGMLCINTDTSLVDELQTLTAEIAGMYHTLAPDASDLASGEQAGLERFSTSSEDLIAHAMSSIETATGKSVAEFGSDERLQAVRQMNADGVFLLKGAVAQVAQAMRISEPSVYRYLQKARREAH